MERKSIRLRVARELSKFPTGTLSERLWSVKNYFGCLCAYMVARGEFGLAVEYSQYHEYVSKLVDYLLRD